MVDTLLTQINDQTWSNQQFCDSCAAAVDRVLETTNRMFPSHGFRVSNHHRIVGRTQGVKGWQLSRSGWNASDLKVWKTFLLTIQRQCGSPFLQPPWIGVLHSWGRLSCWESLASVQLLRLWAMDQLQKLMERCWMKQTTIRMLARMLKICNNLKDIFSKSCSGAPSIKFLGGPYWHVP